MSNAPAGNTQDMLPVPFEPNESHRTHMPSFNTNFTPRYLYRLVAPRSAGTTNSTMVISPAAAAGRTQDIFKLTSEKAARRLLGHVLWQRGHEEDCNLMSWTSSLLFALQYALYRHNKDNDPLTNIYLVILDTREFPEGTFVQDMEIMRAFAGVDRGLDKFLEFRESPYYFGEYLTQGRLDVEGRCVCTSLQKMIDMGLFELQPGLADEREWKWWPKRVLEFREGFLAQQAVQATEEDVLTAMDLGEECFGGDWAVPAALMFLALQPRKSDDQVIVKGLKGRYTGPEIEVLSLGEIKIEANRLPEVGQFKALVELTHRHYSMSDVDALLSSVNGLKVE